MVFLIVDDVFVHDLAVFFVIYLSIEDTLHLHRVLEWNVKCSIDGFDGSSIDIVGNVCTVVVTDLFNAVVRLQT